MRTTSIGIMLVVLGLYALPGLAQEIEAGAANPVPENSPDINGRVPDDISAAAKEENAGNPAAGETNSISKPAAGPMSATDKIVARFMTLDADASGGVSFEEYMAMVQQRATVRYAAMDADGNGEVSDEEYRAFWKSRMAQWYRLKR